MTGRRRMLCCAALAAISCSAKPAPPAQQSGDLEGDTVAKVGIDRISKQSVQQTAQAQTITVRAALDRLIVDALLAEAARQDLPVFQSSAATRQALARQTLEAIYAEAKARPISDADVAEASKRHWTQVDRPRGYRTIHVVAMVKKDATDEARKKAKAFAEKARKALEPIATMAKETPGPERTDEQRFQHGSKPHDPVAAAFTKAVEALDSDGLEVQAQGLHVFADDGSVIEHGIPRQPGTYDQVFVKAGAELSKTGRGTLSEIVESGFGYHVILLLETTEPLSLSRKERVELMRDSIVGHRCFLAQKTLLERAREAFKVTIPPNAPALMGKIALEPAAQVP